MIAGWMRMAGQVTAVVSGSDVAWESVSITDQTKGLLPWACSQEWK
ncbi:hypothetical protein [Salinifilum ghardaiensis]